MLQAAVMPEFLANPYWTALATEQSAIALGTGLARRFPADVVPFGGVREASPEALDALHRLLAPGETIYITGVTSDTAERLPLPRGLRRHGSFAGWQMRHTSSLEAGVADDPRVEALTGEDAQEMVALTDVAFPGYFRARTYVLGSYFGVRDTDGKLIAMGGERLALAGSREISALCTHPAHRGQGYAALLLGALLRLHREAGLGSLLHVTAGNTGAIALYERLGFRRSGEVVWHRLERL